MEIGFFPPFNSQFTLLFSRLWKFPLYETKFPKFIWSLKCFYSLITPGSIQRTHLEKNNLFKGDFNSFIQMPQRVRKKFIFFHYIYIAFIWGTQKYPERNCQLLRQAGRSDPHIVASQLPRDTLWSRKDWKQHSEARGKKISVEHSLNWERQWNTQHPLRDKDKVSCPPSAQCVSLRAQESMCRKEHQYGNPSSVGFSSFPQWENRADIMLIR